MQIGDIKEFDGVKRKIIGFTVINGEQCPNTEPYLEPADDEEPEDSKEQETETKPGQATEDEGKDPNLSANLACQYCGREIGSPVGLISHERACKMNPANKKEGEK